MLPKLIIHNYHERLLKFSLKSVPNNQVRTYIYTADSYLIKICHEGNRCENFEIDKFVFVPFLSHTFLDKS